ncbi:hypothetical protein C8R48DRAFT_672363 [Suillus tomentosus]|nr:hypothetical protein C8R48DRAFT_672363 [Suillus tomentosus]
MSHEGHHSEGNGMLQSMFIVDMTDVHLSMEKTQVANNEKFDSIQTDVSKIKGSLKQTHKIAEGTSSRLMDLEDVVASNQAKLEDMLDNVHRQLHDIENAMVASNTKMEPIERISTIELSVLALHNVIAKSVEHHKAILQSGKVLYQKLSEEVADTRAEIGQIVDNIFQNISTFHQCTTNDLAALQDSVNRWPDSYLQPTIHNTMTGTTLLSELQSGSENSACRADNIPGHWHAADGETAVSKVDTDVSSQISPFTTEPVTTRTAVVSLSACMDL